MEGALFLDVHNCKKNSVMGVLRKECRKKMGLLDVHMQLQNSFGFVMYGISQVPTHIISTNGIICITIPINIHRCQLIGKVILILQWDQSHFVIELYIFERKFSKCLP